MAFKDAAIFQGANYFSKPTQMVPLKGMMNINIQGIPHLERIDLIGQVAGNWAINKHL
ncbi:hypothetical protein DB41_IR00010 [Neochlamydia sp. TUME1]|nr:hypothetical protein DB41_IR00010 [Neochlamydia sp. TUME1]